MSKLRIVAFLSFVAFIATTAGETLEERCNALSGIPNPTTERPEPTTTRPTTEVPTTIKPTTEAPSTPELEVVCKTIKFDRVCVFPFYVQGVRYETCDDYRPFASGKPYCAWDVDQNGEIAVVKGFRRQSICTCIAQPVNRKPTLPPANPTTAAPSQQGCKTTKNNRDCIFPFYVKGIRYDSCGGYRPFKGKPPYCAWDVVPQTGEIAVVNGFQRYGICTCSSTNTPTAPRHLECTTTMYSRKCVFPFFVNGTRYDNCGDYRPFGGQPYCAWDVDPASGEIVKESGHLRRAACKCDMV